MTTDHRRRRFFGIFGMYYSLNYLSLADATVITFLGPFAIALAGHLLLGESYTMKEATAGGKTTAFVQSRHTTGFQSVVLLVLSSSLNLRSCLGVLPGRVIMVSLPSNGYVL